jgi:hypothetical protein
VVIGATVTFIFIKSKGFTIYNGSQFAISTLSIEVRPISTGSTFIGIIDSTLITIGNIHAFAISQNMEVKTRFTSVILLIVNTTLQILRIRGAFI